MKVAIISLLADAGHIIPLLRVGKLLQNTGMEIKFFGPSDCNKFCDNIMLPYSTFKVEKPQDSEKILKIISRANLFWMNVLYRKWAYTRYFQNVIYNGIQKEHTLYELIVNFKPECILCDSHLFTSTYELIALKLNCPLIFNETFGNYYRFQPDDHISNGLQGKLLPYVLPFLKKIFGKYLVVKDQIFRPKKFKHDEFVSNYILEYYENFNKLDHSKLKKLVISHGTGVLEKKYLSGIINIPDYVFQVGPIAIESKTIQNQDLLRWIECSLKPIAYISFGTMVKGRMPFFSIIIKDVISKGYRILWAHNEKPLDADTNSIDFRWEKWVPQSDILAHERVKIFISHCGSGALREALWFSKPMVCIPFLWDQYYNAWIVEQLCNVPQLNKNSIDLKSFQYCWKMAFCNIDKFKTISDEFQKNEGSVLLVDRVKKFLLIDKF